MPRSTAEWVSSRREERGASLYVHYPCFDGIVSAVLASEFLQTNAGWRIEHFCPINYEARRTWLTTTRLRKPCAVVDFLYHPDADFWADHHVTTFVDDSSRIDFQSRKAGRWLFYDDASGSCASLLWERLAGLMPRRDHYPEMVQWAEAIDSARYSSVEEAVWGTSPALEISFSLIVADRSDYCAFLIGQLRQKSLLEVAKLPAVRAKVEEIRTRINSGLRRLRGRIRWEPGGIVVFNVRQRGKEIISRYAPYCFHPEARYSIGLVRSPRGAKITAMRNPWREFQSVPLGKLFEKYGGGGHQRVASLLVPTNSAIDSQEMLQRLASEIRNQEAQSATANQGVLA